VTAIKRTGGWLAVRPAGCSRLLRLGIAFSLTSAVALAGCTKSPYELAPVQGRVTIDGVPLTQGKVMFAPTARGDNVNPGKPAFGAIGPDGHFTLTTFKEGDGAVVGVHWVTVFGGDQPAAAGAAKRAPAFERVTVPKTQTVVAGEDNQIDVQLTSRDVAKFGRK
jgi:hypothetical protein